MNYSDRDNDTLTIVSWNVNSISKREGFIVDLLKEENPDILMIQETRNTFSESFSVEVSGLGYRIFFNSAVKGRNGVLTIIRSLLRPLKVQSGTLKDLHQAGRLLENIVFFNGSRILINNVYVHQGGGYRNGICYNNVVNKNFPRENYTKKVDFLRRLDARIARHRVLNVYGGDFNVVTFDIDSWHGYENINMKNKVSFTDIERQLMRSMFKTLKDPSYDLEDNKHNFTWYDYRNNLNFKRGMKVDYLLISRGLICSLYRRILKWRFNFKPTSDHIPILYDLRLNRNAG